MSPFDGKCQNLQMSPNIFFWASSYSFRNITILNCWRLERWSRSLRTNFENIFSKFVNNGELLAMNFEYSQTRWMEPTHTYPRVPTHTHTHTHMLSFTHTHTRSRRLTRTRTHTYTHTNTYTHAHGHTYHKRSPATQHTHGVIAINIYTYIYIYKVWTD